MSAHRCVICDRTSSMSLAEYQEQFFAGPYFEDEKTGGEICQECQDAINETLYPDEDDDGLFPLY